jgi:hypothetical protein
LVKNRKEKGGRGEGGINEDTDDGKYRCEEEEVVGEDWGKVKSLVASSWGHC